jgi:predicted MPP superfamily phosphohydrolase
LVFGVVLVTVGSLTIYASWIEPYWIEVTHHHIAAPFGSPLKIAHLTDIHTSGLGSREMKLLQVMETEQPDVIVITGDSINITSDYLVLSLILMKSTGVGYLYASLWTGCLGRVEKEKKSLACE